MTALLTPPQQAEALLHGIDQGLYPGFLWKYRPNSSYTDDIFKSQALYFPTPPQLNDPFDCQIQPVTPTAAEVAHWVHKHNPGEAPEKVLAMIDQATRNLDSFRKNINKHMRKNIDPLGVCSFTTNPDHPLMWAHYTVSHQGLCLGFDVKADPDLFLIPLKVHYSATYPAYNHLTQSKKLAEIVLSTKSNHWVYEDELRVMKTHLPADHKIKFNPQALKEVIFGRNMDIKERKRIKLLARQNGFKHVTFRQAIVTGTSYDISFIPC